MCGNSTAVERPNDIWPRNGSSVTEEREVSGLHECLRKWIESITVTGSIDYNHVLHSYTTCPSNTQNAPETRFLLTPAVLAVLVALSFLFAILVGVWILHPLDRAARFRRARLQFTVIDFLGLVFLLQLPMGLIKLAIQWHPGRGDTRGPEMMMYALAWVLTGLVWSQCVATFSRAGVTSARDRGWTVFLVLPMAYMGTFAVPVLFLAALAGNVPPHWKLSLIVIALIIAAGLIGSGIISRQVANRAQTPLH